jgi:hypothetical protein
MPGAIIYRGPSRIDGKPIVAIAVWDSSNRKTGAMLQTYILREDIDPRDANKYGEDYSICGDCAHKGVPTLDPAKKLADERSCYVVMGQGPTIVFKTLKRGGYPDASHDRKSVGAGRMVRIGTYGDGAAVPDDVWADILTAAKGHTAYSHNGGDPTTYMVSADSLAQAAKAWRNNERTFRVIKDRHEIVKGQEIECPASKGVQCINCGLCAGTSVQAKSIAIVVHGGGAKYF